MRRLGVLATGVAAVLALGAVAAVAVEPGEAPLKTGEAPPPWHYEGGPPGSGKTLPRGWAVGPGITAPPQIPHDVTGLSIAPNSNACLGCHAPEVAPSVKAKAVPETHYRGDPYDPTSRLKQLNGNRYNCRQCHVPQANVKPLVKSVF